MHRPLNVKYILSTVGITGQKSFGDYRNSLATVTRYKPSKLLKCFSGESWLRRRFHWRIL